MLDLDTMVVWQDARPAGELSIDKGGAMHIAYAPECLADETAPALSSHAMPSDAMVALLEILNRHPEELDLIRAIRLAA
jgi:hypothetical protein